MVKKLISQALFDSTTQEIGGRASTKEDWVRRAYLRLIRDVWVQSYIDGEMGLEAALINTKRSVTKMVEQLGLSEKQRVSIATSYLGYATWQALDSEPAKRTRGNKIPSALKAFSKQVVEMYLEQGFSKSPGDEETAFAKASEFITAETKWPATTKQVIDWYYS